MRGTEERRWLAPDIVRWVRDLLGSMWLQPCILAVAGAALGLLMPRLELRRGTFGTSTTMSAEGAANLLGVGATTLGALLAVGFSIATVTVQLAASQYTPRLLRRFMADRTTKRVLGAFTGSLTYVLVVMRSVRRGADAPGDEFVPYASVVLGSALVVGCVALLPFFLHHVTRSIQVATIVTRIAKDTAEQVKALELDGELAESDAAAAPERVTCRKPGYVRVFDVAALLDALPRGCRRARVEVAVGEFVLPGAPLVSLWPGGALDEKAAGRVERAFAFSRQRDVPQDVLFGVRQLVDIALKALSPGVNDVTTAIMALNELGALTVAVVHGGAPATARWRVVRRPGRVVLVSTLPVELFVRAAFDDVVLAGREQPRVVARVLEIFEHLAGTGVAPDVGAVIDAAANRAREIAASSALPAPARRTALRRAAPPFGGDPAAEGGPKAPTQ